METPAPKIILAAIHGILTSPVAASWPDELDAWLFERDCGIKVLKKEYAAGPFPRWNCWVKDPLIARSLVNEILLFHPGGLPPGTAATAASALPSIWLVAHSNGAVIALLTTKMLLARGCQIDGTILIGGACEPDIRRNGVLAWTRSRQLGCAIAYCSQEDGVLDTAQSTLPPLQTLRTLATATREWLWGKLIFPYGCLGRTGWRLDRDPVPEALGERLGIRTRFYRGGHSAYFEPARREETFQQILEDIRSAAPDDNQLNPLFQTKTSAQ
jgi:hypothetical protein